MHILIVEDEQGLRENLCERLRGEGHVVEVAADGEDELAAGTVVVKPMQGGGDQVAVTRSNIVAHLSSPNRTESTPS